MLLTRSRMFVLIAKAMLAEGQSWVIGHVDYAAENSCHLRRVTKIDR